MNHARTRRWAAGTAATTLLAGVLSLVMLQPASATTCGTSSISLALNKGGLIRAASATGATGTLTATATVTENGSADPTESVTFVITGDNSASVSPNPVTTSADPGQPSPPYTPGQYKTTVTAGTNPGTFTLTATYVTGAGLTCSDSKVVTEFGDPTNVSVALNPAAVPVSGLTTSTSSATATVTDAGGRRVNDVSVTFTVGTPDPPTTGGSPTAKATVANRPPGSTNNNADGTYTDTINASSDPSRQTIIATVTGNPSGTAASSPAGQATLVQYGDPASVALSFSPTSLVANGTSSVTASAAVVDSAGNPVPGETVSFVKTTGPAVTFTPASATATTDAGGDARVTVGGATTTGTTNITALTQTASKQNTQGLPVVAPVPASVSLALAPSSLPADGRSTSNATVTVLDQAGVALPGAAVLISRPGRSNVPATDQGNGTYKAVIVANGTPGTETLTATASKNGTSKTSSGTTLTSTAVAETTTTTTTAPPTPPAAPQGYSLVGGDGSLYAFGTAKNFGDMKGKPLTKPIIGVAYTPGGNGYWLVAEDGGIFTFGDAQFYGSMGDKKINSPVLGMAATPTGKGYWLFAGDGGIFTFGDAAFFGSMGDKKLNAPVINMEPIASGGGYWLVAADGGIFRFGSAEFYGSMGDKKINQPVFDMTSTDTDKGYWLVARDGGIFSFGDAGPKFYGNPVNDANPKPTKIIGMDSTPSSQGYWIADTSGKVWNYGDAQALGDRYGASNPAAMIGFAAVPGTKP
jgi:hypothetical protein